MLSETLNVTGTGLQRMPATSERIDVSRKTSTQDSGNTQGTNGKSSLPPEEILNRIKALTEDGMYSVRFETDLETHQMVVKVVDNESGDVIRQIPPEGILGLKEALSDFEGNIVNTQS